MNHSPLFLYSVLYRYGNIASDPAYLGYPTPMVWFPLSLNDNIIAFKRTDDGTLTFGKDVEEHVNERYSTPDIGMTTFSMFVLGITS